MKKTKPPPTPAPPPTPTPPPVRRYKVTKTFEIEGSTHSDLEKLQYIMQVPVVAEVDRLLLAYGFTRTGGNTKTVLKPEKTSTFVKVSKR